MIAVVFTKGFFVILASECLPRKSEKMVRIFKEFSFHIICILCMYLCMYIYIFFLIILQDVIQRLFYLFFCFKMYCEIAATEDILQFEAINN